MVLCRRACLPDGWLHGQRHRFPGLRLAACGLRLAACGLRLAALGSSGASVANGARTTVYDAPGVWCRLPGVGSALRPRRSETSPDEYGQLGTSCALGVPYRSRRPRGGKSYRRTAMPSNTGARWKLRVVNVTLSL